MFGLTLTSDRSVPYERVDPKAARELFIRHALVLMEYDSRAPFFEHNLKLLEEVEYLQQKGRRVDLLGDEQQLYDFFDARIPAGISTGAAFETWRRKAEAQEPKLLWLSERDIAPGDAELDSTLFPDHLTAGPLVVQLRYRFEPGHEDDGVTALIPFHVLNQIPVEPFEWLVPGLLDEKIEALVRSLPKNLRVHFVPVPDAVARVLPLLERGRGSLHAQIGDALAAHRRRAGAARCLSRGSAAAASAHQLRAHRRYGQGDCRARAAWPRCAERHAGAAQQEYAKQSELTTGARSWVFGDLPERQDAALEYASRWGIRRWWMRATAWGCAYSRHLPRRA